ncbi:B12-binding domain-containing protein, partial [Candidatus Bathyarchaeota archaeon]|nr:B12-binding domain-containing protein [Candidatus Bathyarchaeota archaeon]
MEEELMDAIVNMEEEDALLVARNMLDGGTDPMRIMEVCRRAMEVVGERFEEGEYFVPELIMSGEVLRQIADVIRPEMGEASQEKRLGKVVIGTVAGDIHDLGKNIVTF